jgi:adenylate cyclase
LSKTVEIERKFLVNNDSWLRNVSNVISIEQMYLVNDGVKNVRIRKSEERGRVVHYLTIKSCNSGMSRVEIEHSLSDVEYNTLKGLADQGSIAKRRFAVIHGVDRWEVDVFDNGLVIAEIEIDSEDYELMLPSWVGEEVTDKKEYYNADMAQ